MRDLLGRMAGAGMPGRRCEGCGGMMPPRTHRQARPSDGAMVCGSCMISEVAPRPLATAGQDSLDEAELAELRARMASAQHSIMRTRPVRAARTTRYRMTPEELVEHLRVGHGWSPEAIEEMYAGDLHGNHVGLHELADMGELAQPRHRHVSLQAVESLQATAHESSSPPHYEPYGYDRPVSNRGITTIGHESSDDLETLHCLAGETRYLTRLGVRTLAETVGTTQLVLTANPGTESIRRSGRWVEAHIHEFGEQPLLHVRLRRNGLTKDLYATRGHRWLLQSGPHGRTFDRFETTDRLIPGHRLSHLRQARPEQRLDREGARRGIHFGDGVSNRARDTVYGSVVLWGAKAKYLAEFFEEIGATPHDRTAPSGLRGVSYSAKMTGYAKELPDLDRDASYLYGWLAGYFAADGSVSRNQVALNSSSFEALARVRDVCTVLGIGTYPISTSLRRGYGSEPTPSHDLTLARGDLTPEFFLLGHHRERFEAMGSRPDRFGWTVVSVEPTDRVETVYCAVVPGSESFALEDNIWTGNCPWCGSGQIIGQSDGTVSCGYCDRTYTVRLQPTYPAMPQAIDGQPYPPGQPGAMPGAPGDEVPGQLPAGMEEVDESAPPGAEPPGEGVEEGEGGDDDLPAFLKGSTLRTAMGDELPVDAYLRHLALVESGYAEPVLASVREDSALR